MLRVESVPRLSSVETCRLVKLAAAGDRAATDRVVRSNLGLVFTIAAQLCRETRLKEDLLQEGYLGLIEAIRHYEPDRGAAFATCAGYWIRARIYDHLLHLRGPVRIGTAAGRRVFFNLKRNESDGSERTPATLAAHLQVDEDEVKAVVSALAAPVDSTERSDVAASPLREEEDRRPDRQCERGERIAQTRKALRRLARHSDPREREVIRQRWLAAEPMPFRDLGLALGVSGERVRQLETRLMQRLRRQLDPALAA